MHRHQRLDEAEIWYRRAEELGSLDAAVHLDDLIEERGEDGAHGFWRRAAEEGNVDAANRLTVSLYEQGKRAAAEAWARQAAATGDDVAIRNSTLLAQAAREADQEGTTRRPGPRLWTRDELTKLRNLAERGDSEAARSLGDLFRGRDDPSSAEAWYRRAARAGDAGAANSLALLLSQPDRGELRQAIAWWRWAEREGDWNASNNLRILTIVQHPEGVDIEALLAEEVDFDALFSEPDRS